MAGERFPTVSAGLTGPVLRELRAVHARHSTAVEVSPMLRSSTRSHKIARALDGDRTTLWRYYSEQLRRMIQRRAEAAAAELARNKRVGLGRDSQ